MIKVYIGKLLELPVIEVLYPNVGNTERANIFGEKIFENFKEPVVAIVDNPEQADYFLIPHNYRFIKKNKEYIDQFVNLSQKFSKNIIVFLLGDSDEEVIIPHSIVFRHSQYKFKKRPNEIIMPAYAVDLGSLYGVSLREKGEKPIVGFCGWAGHNSFMRKIKDYIKNTVINLKSISSHRYYRALKQGIFFRIEVMKALKNNARILTNFIVRKTYGGNSKTITVSPQDSRIEYIKNMKTSDFILNVKGDGNFSTRFFETLSLGRIPLLIDTECILPLEFDIDYSFIFRQDYTLIPSVGENLTSFFVALSPENFMLMQAKARENFDKYLKIDVFFKFIFSENNLKRYANVK